MAGLGITGIVDETQIGSGGNAVVYRARETAHDRWVAVKVLRGTDEGTRRRFERERKAMGRLSDHEGIVAVYRSGFTDGSDPYLVMPLLEHGSLQDRIDRSGPIEWREACATMAEVADTLQYAHDRSVIHRDLKPANILVSASGRPLIADFGISRFTGASATVGSVALTFTPSFCPPEVIEGAEPYPGADVYGLGATLFALLSGEPPFPTRDEESIFSVIRRIASEPVPDLRRRGVPDEVCALLEQSMAKDPNQRVASAGDFAAALRQVLARPARPEPSPPPGPDPGATIVTPRPDLGVPEPGRHGRSSRAPALVAMAALVFAIAGLAAAFLATRGSGSGDETTTTAAGDDTAQQVAEGSQTSDDPLAPDEDGGNATDQPADGAGQDVDDLAPVDDTAPVDDDGSAEAPIVEPPDGGPGDVDQPVDLSGTTVTIIGSRVDADAEAFVEALAPLVDRTGIDIRYTGTRDARSEIDTAVTAGAPPDLALTGSDHVGQLAAGGSLVPVPDRVINGIGDAIGPGWFEGSAVDGTVYGIPVSAEPKGIVWYNPQVFEANGYTVPETWRDVDALSERMIADGIAPWCIGMESGVATGWVFTDWMEDAMLRLHGPVAYDRWVRHEIPFTASEVEDAARFVTDIWLNDDLVLGGSESILQTSAIDGGLGVLDGSCGLHRQLPFNESVFVGAGGVAGEDFAVFNLPSITDDTTVVVGSASYAVAFADRPEVEAVLEYMGTAEYADARLRAGSTLFSSPHRDHDTSLYPSPISRAITEIMLGADLARLDASDRMPAEVGSGSFWTGATDLIAGNIGIEEFLADVEASWPG